MAGYNTYGYSTATGTTPNYGYSRGFDRYYFHLCDKELGIATADSAFSWAREQHRKSGCERGEFFYLHLLEAHAPYYPLRDFEWEYSKISKKDVLRDVKKYRKIKGALDFTADQIEFFKDLHRAELDYCMHEIDQFLMYLKDKGIYDDSFIIVVGDHGNNFTEHCPIGTVDLYQEYVKVGFAVKYPKAWKRDGIEKKYVNATIDIVPTIADMLGVEKQGFFNGASLLSDQKYQFGGILGNAVISEDLYVDRYSVAIRNPDYTFIYRTYFNGTTFKNFKRKDEKFELYDMRIDPGEKKNIFSQADTATRKKFIKALNMHVSDALKYHGIKQEPEIAKK